MDWKVLFHLGFRSWEQPALALDPVGDSNPVRRAVERVRKAVPDLELQAVLSEDVPEAVGYELAGLGVHLCRSGARGLVGAVQEAHRALASRQAVVLPAAAALVDPEMIEACMDFHRRHERVLTFVRHLPAGLSPEVVDVPALIELARAGGLRDTGRTLAEAFFDRRKSLAVGAILTPEAAASPWMAQVWTVGDCQDGLAWVRAILERVGDGAGPAWRKRLIEAFRFPGPELFAPPHDIGIEVTSYCNLACIHCPYPQMTRPKAHMGSALYRKLVDELAAYPSPPAIGLTGMGESLLNRELFDLIRYADKKGLIVNFSTNATVLTEAMAEKILDSGLDYLFVSIDGAEKETYEKVRVHGKFDRVVENTLRLCRMKKERGQAGPWIVVRMIDTIYSKGQAAAFRALFQAAADEVNIRECYTWSGAVVDIAAEQRGQPAQRQPCPQLWWYPFISQSGDVYLCRRDYDGTVVLGSLATESLRSVWTGPKVWDLRRRHLGGRTAEIALCGPCDEDWTYG